MQADRPAVVLTEGRGVSRPGKQDDEEEKAGGGVTLKEGPGVTRPTAEEAISPKAGGPKETRTRVMSQPAQENQVRGLWLWSKKNSNLTTLFTSRWCSSRVSNQCFLSRI